MGELTTPVNQVMRVYAACGEYGEMVMVGMFFAEALMHVAPELDVPDRAEVVGGMTDMLMGWFTILKSQPVDMAEMAPYAARFAAMTGAVGRHLPPDWMRVQLESLRTAAASMENTAHRRVIEAIVSAAAPAPP